MSFPYRYRTQTHVEGKSVLLAWMQRRCRRCGRFLSKRQSVWCSECAKEIGDMRRITAAKERNKFRITINGKRIYLPCPHLRKPLKDTKTNSNIEKQSE